MLKLFKWLWDKAEQHGEDKILAEIHGMISYHRMKSELVYLKEKYEPDNKKRDGRDNLEKFIRPPLTPQEHSAVARELNDFLNRHDEVHNGR